MRYRRGSRIEATASDPTAPPIPKAANATRESARAAAGLILHRERQQHLDRAHDHQHQQDREQQGGQQPPGAHHVDEPVADVDDRGDHGMPGAIDVPPNRGASRISGQHRDRADLQHRDDQERDARGRRPR